MDLKMAKRKIELWWNRIIYPENVWYGGGLKRSSALSSIGEGWRPIINNLYDAKPKHVKVWQVKEKFGGLRFYINSAPEWYHDLISYYEHESYETCERCGKRGVLREDLSWVLTLCDKHYQEHLIEIRAKNARYAKLSKIK